ncbi:TonB-dependent siderophore receptor [Novosphingobium pentaromativorans]|uniref:TonB-dependent siderophore receptor, putative n=1 Tax=Novosphingobium pentaromativorans US6-1 TaxID=1088721 RepID=G6EI23_9SPHN|nr:TonB-dependent siderophore receptor [Novosphingobium pentaromativorans]AIT78657.1 ferrisiderophore receptor [Novosphingobium pentaromativorans US6-1]EHJ59157.1 TonB-dependent siderophore receptor, putative [Novosphingobium pentaromativorans US6-1]
MKTIRIMAVCCTALVSLPAMAEEAADVRDAIVVTGARADSGLALKTDTPAIETPQPVTVIPEDLYTAQGAISVSDTLRYVAGVQSNPYGPDSRVDGGFVRGIDALQFRDGMRDVYSYYASIRADPYNFSSVQVIRGPASVLFGQGSLGGIINLTSKKPQFESAGEVSLLYGSHDRKEMLADLTGPLSSTLAGRVVARVRDSGTQTDHVPDDRVMISPSLTWSPDARTDLTLIGLYQEDDGGSTSQFLPLVGTILPNPNGQLKNSLFVGKPGWDRYDGRLLQGTAMLGHRFSDNAKINLKARYIDSDLTYFSHYPNSYSNPANPYLDEEQRLITLIAAGSKARMEIFSSDNNVQFDFTTGSAVEHKLLAGVDYSWNRVRKTDGYAYETIDIYDIDRDTLSDFGGGLPPGAAQSDDTRQEQLGLYLQDQVRFADRISVVLGVRRDKVTSRSFGMKAIDESATSFRAGAIGEVVPGVSPFFSFTESFEPIAGTDVYGDAYAPKRGRQFEAGVKFHPGEATLVTVTAYHIKERNRPVSVAVEDPDNPGNQITGMLQIGESFSKGIEVEGSTVLPGDFQILANFSYNKAEEAGSGQQLDNVPKYNASLWATRPFQLSPDVALLLGGGVRHTGGQRSYGPAFPDGLRTPGYTLVDALAEVSWQNWSFRVNATNLLGKSFYSSCLARGDCFMGEERNVFGTVSYRF